MKYKSKYISPLGELIILASDNYISHLFLTDNKRSNIYLNQEFETKETPLILELKENLDKYFKGYFVNFSNIPIKPECTDFQRRIYSILVKQPYGTLTTYGKIAEIYQERFNINKLSAQAVGGALNRNPILILIPCHRVIMKNNTLGGFGGGVDRKKQLIELEKYGNKKTEKENIKKKKSY